MEKEKNICRIEGCNNYGENKGRDKNGEKRYRKICEFHRNINKNPIRAMRYLIRKKGDNRELKKLS